MATLLQKVWDAHTVRKLPNGQTQLLLSSSKTGAGGRPRQASAANAATTDSSNITK